MERLLVDRVDRHLRAAEQRGIVERADLHDDGRELRTRRQMGAAFGAELARDRLFEVGARELLGSALGVAEARQRHTMNMLGAPPVMYWHSRQWHWAFIIGSPSAA